MEDNRRSTSTCRDYLLVRAWRLAQAAAVVAQDAAALASARKRPSRVERIPSMRLLCLRRPLPGGRRATRGGSCQENGRRCRLCHNRRWRLIGIDDRRWRNDRRRRDILVRRWRRWRLDGWRRLVLHIERVQIGSNFLNDIVAAIYQRIPDNSVNENDHEDRPHSCRCHLFIICIGHPAFLLPPNRP